MKAAALAVLLLTVPARAEDCVPPPGGKCLTKDQSDAVKKAVKELDDIHSAPATVTVEDPLIVVQDWDGRVYVSGGSTKPVRMKLQVGPTVERDLAVSVPVQVYYRPKPPDPMFRLRVRAQAHLLPLEAFRTDDAGRRRFWDASVGFDFFHLGPVNVSAHVGVYTFGAGLGLDLTSNFGIMAGYAMTYDGFRSTAHAGCYFAF